MSKPILEPAAQAFADAAAKPPFLYELGPAAARRVLDDIQAAPIDKLDVDEKWIVLPAAAGEVAVRIVRPQDATQALPVILYVHGGGWIREAIAVALARDRGLRDRTS